VASQVLLLEPRIPRIWEFSVEMGPLATDLVLQKQRTHPTPLSRHDLRRGANLCVLEVSKASHFEV